jgi:hypothetical protein
MTKSNPSTLAKNNLLEPRPRWCRHCWASRENSFEQLKYADRRRAEADKCLEDAQNLLDKGKQMLDQARFLLRVSLILFALAAILFAINSV